MYVMTKRLRNRLIRLAFAVPFAAVSTVMAWYGRLGDHAFVAVLGLAAVIAVGTEPFEGLEFAGLMSVDDDCNHQDAQ